MASFLKLPILPCTPYPKPTSFRNSVTCSALPARDKVIDFGKYKGRMLGTLPSTYLKWVSSNLRAQDFEEWAHLADQVLEDPVYNDRVEWEYADKLLNGNALGSNSKSLDSVAELIEISQRFGWDNEDKSGWSKIDFQMLGTSKGGRIPRVREKHGGKSVSLTRDTDKRDVRSSIKSERKLNVSETRIERRERLRMRKSVTNVSTDKRFNNVGEDERRKSSGESDVYNPFPGRETLLRKVFNQRKTG